MGDIGDLVIVPLISPPLGWIALVGVLIFFVAVVVAIFKTMKNRTGKMYWWGDMRSVAGKRRLALVSAIIIAATSVLLQITTSSREGLCSQSLYAQNSVKEPYYPSDEEFIRRAVKSEPTLILGLDRNFTMKTDEDVKLVDNLTMEYLARNPDCCKVFRKRESEVGSLSWAQWRDAVVVKAQSEESLNMARRGEKNLMHPGIYYIAVGNCLNSANVINELTPGG